MTEYNPFECPDNPLRRLEDAEEDIWLEDDEDDDDQRQAK